MNERIVPVSDPFSLLPYSFLNRILLFIFTFGPITGTLYKETRIVFPLPMLPRRNTLVFVHIAGWLLFMGLMLGFALSAPGNHQLTQLLFSGRFLIFCGVYLFLFYFNSYFLLPWFYLKRMYFLYFLSITLLFLLICYLKPFDTVIAETHFPSAGHQIGPASAHPPMMPPPGRNGPQIDIVSVVLFIMVWSFSAAIQMVKKWQTTERRAVQAEADKANAELSFLKAQINPHFLFNTLNNIYAMAVSKAAETPDAIMKLSHIMRYVTEEVSGDFSSLESEVACITDYIELQKLRLNEKVLIRFRVSGHAKGRQIAPLVLMTFVENAFKYGISNHTASPITIQVEIMADQLTFFCQNKIFNPATTAGNTGIGIENTRKRLQHLYPGRHTLHITTGDSLFTVALMLPLS